MSRIAPWRFLAFFAVLASGWCVGPFLFSGNQALLIGFDLAAATFLASYVGTLRHEPDEIRALAERSDANRAVLLLLSAVLAVVVLVAIVGEVGLRGRLGLPDKVLIVVSSILVWTFGHAVCTLHYAHLFYAKDAAGNDCGGLVFPGTPEPRMGDFVYFAFTLGVAVQTSDVSITGRHIRNVVTGHTIVGFFFNLGVLALAINLLAAS